MSDTTSTGSTLGLNVDVVPVITAGLTLAGDVVKLTDDELAVLNSPENQAARVNAQKQAIEDQDALDAQNALKTGDLSKVNVDQSP